MKKYLALALNLVIFAALIFTFFNFVGWNACDCLRKDFPYYKYVNENKYAEIISHAEKNLDNKDFRYHSNVAYLFFKGVKFYVKPDFNKALKFYFAEEKLRGLGLYEYMDVAMIYEMGGYGIEKNEAKSEEVFNKAMSLIQTEESSDWVYSKKDMSISCFYECIERFYEDEFDTFGNLYKEFAVKMLKYSVDNNFPLDDKFFELPYDENNLREKALENLNRRVLDGKKMPLECDRALYLKLALEGKFIARDFSRIYEVLDACYLKDKLSISVEEAMLLAVLCKNGAGGEKNPKKADEILNFLKNAVIVNEIDLVDFANGGKRLYNGSENYPIDKEFALEIMSAFEDIISKNKAEWVVLKSLIDFYKDDVKDFAKVEALYGKFAPKSKMAELGYAKYLESKKAKKQASSQ